jgi:Ca2+-binding RTX toxin-like protein
VIDGSSTAPRSVVEGVGLPTETDVPLPPVAPTGDPSQRVATLNVFDDGQPTGDVGTMGTISTGEFGALQTLYSSALQSGLAQSQFDQIEGLHMGGPVTFHPPGAEAVTFDGGITYRNIDVVDVLLGSRSTSLATEGLFTVTATLPGAITVVQGGGGYKRLVATGGGGYTSPLILLGNTTQDGSFYNSTTGNLTGGAREFLDPGQSVIDASLDPNPVIIYGGVGDSTIYGGGGGDQIAGGSGADTIYAGSGNDLIHANDGFNLDLSHPLAQVVAQGLSALIVTHDPSPSDAPTGDPLNPTSDQIYAGIGHDIVLMDHGVVDQLSNPITGTQGVLDAYTTDPISFGLSSVFGAFNGSAIVLAGTGQQVINLGQTKQANVIVKNGYVYFDRPDGWVQHLAKVGSSSPGAGGNDKIVTGNGNDVIVAGTGYDKITGGDGNKIVLADDGQVTWKGGVLSQVVSQDPGVSNLSTLANTVTLGNGNDIVFGGSGANTITLGNGNDIVAGALGQLTFDSAGQPATLQSAFPTYGGNNTISLGGGNGVVIGGPGQSTITAGPGYAVIPGTGTATYSPARGAWTVAGSTPAPAPVVAAPAPAAVGAAAAPT